MAEAEHLKLVLDGANATWNWRGGRLDLRDAELSGIRLRGALLDQADLRGARLIGADLTGSPLRLHDRSIIVCSKHAIRDPVVNSELLSSNHPARKKPIFLQLDEASLPTAQTTVALDFSRWGDFRAYLRAFDGLLQVLLESD